MKQIQELIPGQNLNNEELQNTFRCSGQGGMRRSLETNSLVIVSNHIKSIYDDRWIGPILYYTGMGSTGDQSFDFMQNRTLLESRSNGISVYLFEVFDKKIYTYKGKVALAQDPFMEEQDDINNKRRKVCIFPLIVVTCDSHAFIEESILNSNYIQKVNRLKKLDNNSLLTLAKQGLTNPTICKTQSVYYQRNPAVAEYVKRIAQGICQLCFTKTPFNDKNGVPFLETHHIKWLSKGGSDTIENSIALCPNCHAKMHVVDDPKDKKHLKKIAENFNL